MRHPEPADRLPWRRHGRALPRLGRSPTGLHPLARNLEEQIRRGAAVLETARNLRGTDWSRTSSTPTPAGAKPCFSRTSSPRRAMSATASTITSQDEPRPPSTLIPPGPVPVACGAAAKNRRTPRPGSLPSRRFAHGLQRQAIRPDFGTKSRSSTKAWTRRRAADPPPGSVCPSPCWSWPGRRRWSPTCPRFGALPGLPHLHARPAASAAPAAPVPGAYHRRRRRQLRLRLPGGQTSGNAIWPNGPVEPGRVHFLGKLAYPDYLAALAVSACHVYLTYPFVLSWS